MANDFINDSRCVAYWKFEPGALEADSKSSHTLVNVNTATEETTIVKFGSGSARLAYATNEYFRIADSDLAAAFPFKGGTTNKTMTIAIWFYSLSAANRGQGLYAKDGLSIYVNMGTSTDNAFISGTGWSSARPLGPTFNENCWNLLIVSIDANNGLIRSFGYAGDTGSIYINDVVVRSSARPSPSTGDVYIGTRSSTTDSFEGYIDECVIFNEVLTYREMRSIYEQSFPTLANKLDTNQYVTGSSLEGRFRFEIEDGIVGDTARKNTMVKGDGNNKALILPDTTNYKQGASSARFYPGTSADTFFYRSDYNLSDDFPFKFGKSNNILSAAFWFRPTAVSSSQQPLIGKHTGLTGGDPEYYQYGFRIYLNTTNVMMAIQYGTYNQSTETKTLFSGIGANKWYHLSFYYNRSTKEYFAKLWDDTAGTATTIGPLTTTNALVLNICANFNIGGQMSDSYYYFGQMDEVAIFNDQLTEAEMDSIRAGTYDFANDANCVSLYNFELPDFNQDSKGTNHLLFSNYPGTSESGYRREGYCHTYYSTTTDDNAFIIPTEGQCTNFPFKNGTSGQKNSILFWLNMNAFQSRNYYMVSKGNFDSGSTAISFYIWYDYAAAILKFTYGHSGTSRSTINLITSPVAGRWYHIAITHDQTTKALRIIIWDDTANSIILNYSATLANAIQSCAGAFVLYNQGASDETVAGSYSASGRFDDLMFFSSILSDAMIEALRIGAILPPTEIRQTREDISGNDYDLTDSGTVPVGIGTGRIGLAALFDGSGIQQLTRTGAPDLTADVHFTIGFWFRVTKTGTGTVPWHLTIGALDIQIGFNADQSLAFVSADTTGLSVNTGDIVEQDKYALAIIYYDGSNLKVSINDADADSAAGSTGILAAASTVVMGFLAAADMEIIVDEVAIWLGASALSTAQRSTLYSGNYGQRPAFA